VARRLVIAAAAVVAACGLTGTAAAATGRISDDPLQSQEWWLHDVGADQATPPGPGVPIAIVDSGLDVTTPEFAGRPNITLLNSQTVFGSGEWHGTFVASVAAAPANGVGIVGVYPQAALEIWDASPVENISPFSGAVGIETAAQHCPGVISLSFGSRTPSQQIAVAIIDAFHHGCLVVASAGNDRQQGSPPSYPADQAHVLTIAATDQNDQVANFSTSSPNNDLAAPGVGIVGAVPLSHDPSGFVSDENGTSFSAPIVAAAAAWLWTVRPTLDWTQIEEILRSTARDIGAPGFDADTGWGIVNIPAVLAAATPPRDPFEPNDDIDQVKPGAMFDDGQPAITTAVKPSIRIAGTVDQNEDPRDLYRIWVPAKKVVRVSVAAGGAAAARIWGPQAVSIEEVLAARRRDLVGTQITGGKRGFTAYVEVLPTGRSTRASYVLSVKASKS
jgi:Subtilase family